jgi:hypothetical protein
MIPAGSRNCEEVVVVTSEKDGFFVPLNASSQKEAQPGKGTGQDGGAGSVHPHDDHGTGRNGHHGWYVGKREVGILRKVDGRVP